MYVWNPGYNNPKEFGTTSSNLGTHKLNSLRSAEHPPIDQSSNLNRNIKINQKRREESIKISSMNLQWRIPTTNLKTLQDKDVLDSEQLSVYSSKKSQFFDSSQNSYPNIFNAQYDNAGKNFLSLEIKISLSETSSTLAQPKEALGKTNLSSLIFVALRHQEPVFQTFERQDEDSNVMYGPLVLLIKAERNGMVLNEENKRIKVEIDFPTSDTLYHSSSKQMKIENMGKVSRKNTFNVGNATYDNFDYHHCVVWDTWLNTFRKNSKVCQTLSINATHTKCICTKIGRFGLVKEATKDAVNYKLNEPITNDYNGENSLFSDENEGLATKEGNQVTNNVPWLDNEIEYKGSTSFMIIIITISSSVLVVTVLGIGLLVFYCKRVKVRPIFFNKMG